MKRVLWRMPLNIPANARKLEMRNSVVYLDQKNILYSISNPGPQSQLSDDEIVAEVDRLLQFTGGKKVCMVVDASPNSQPIKKEQRDVISEQLNRVVKALAVITRSPLSNMVINLYFNFKPPVYPTKLFTNEEDAMQWVNEMCERLK